MNPFGAATPASAPVYRSIPISESTSSVFGIERTAGKSVPVSSPESSSSGKLDIPFAPFDILLENGVYLDHEDVPAIQKKLLELCSTCVLKRSKSACEFHCQAQAEDGNEQCRFSVNLWRDPKQPAVVVQADRHSGCPYLFRQLIAKSVGDGNWHDKPKWFRVPDLPEEILQEESAADIQSVEEVIRYATSDLLEQRIAGLAVAADLCNRSTEFCTAFKSLNGFSRIASLKQDSNIFVQKAVSRILAA